MSPPLLILAILFFASPPPPSGGWTISQPQTAWSDVDDRERQIVLRMLEGSDWPFRVLGLERLGRYRGAEVASLVRDRLADDAWPVRCAALRACAARDLDLDEAERERETHPIALRALLRCGYEAAPGRVDATVAELMRSTVVDDRLLAAELARLGGSEAARTQTAGYVKRLARTIDGGDVAIHGLRLARLLDAADVFRTYEEWRRFFRGVEVPEALTPARVQPIERRSSRVAELSFEDLSRLLDYLEALRQRDLELVIVIDATGSMQAVIDGTRAEVDALIRLQSDLSRSFRLGLVAYRDRVDRVSWQGLRFTGDVREARAFLRRQEAKGGGDYPEAVLLGLQRADQLRWADSTSQSVVLIGDAPPHEADWPALRELLASFAGRGRPVHTVCVGEERFRADSRADFAEIARLGGGRSVELDDPGKLVVAVMRFTMEPAWWGVFDEFYGWYARWCR